MIFRMRSEIVLARNEVTFDTAPRPFQQLDEKQRTERAVALLLDKFGDKFDIRIGEIDTDCYPFRGYFLFYATQFCKSLGCSYS